MADQIASQNPFSEDFVKGLAGEFDLDPDSLQEALDCAYNLYEEEPDACNVWDNQRKHHAAIKQFLEKMVRPVLGAWDGLHPDVRQAVQRYISPVENDQDEVRERLTFVTDLLEEFLDYYFVRRGRKRRSTAIGNIDLRPLHIFTRVLVEYWTISAGRPFGHEITDIYEDESSDPNTGDLMPESIALRFLWACVKRLDKKYTLANSVTSVRSAKRKQKKKEPQNFLFQQPASKMKNPSKKAPSTV